MNSDLEYASAVRKSLPSNLAESIEKFKGELGKFYRKLRA